MKISSEILRKYLKEINCFGMINEVKLNFEDNGVSALVMSVDNITMVSNKLSNSDFIKYEKIGAIVIDNLSVFIRILERFKDDIVLKKEENFLKIFNENRECDFVLVSEDFVEGVKKIPEIKYKNILKIDSEIIKESIRNSKIMGDVFSTIKFDLKDKTLIIECGETTKITDKHKLNEKYENCFVKFSAEFLEKTIFNLDGEIELSLGKDLPIKIVKTTDNTNLFYIIAPRVENE